MSGQQPGDDHAIDRPDPPDRSDNPDGNHDSGDARLARPTPSSETAPGPAEASRIASFEAFKRFASSAEADDRTLAGPARRDSWRRQSGALLPGAWARPGDADQGGDQGAGHVPAAGAAGEAKTAVDTGTEGPPKKRQRASKLPDWRRLLGRPRASGASDSSRSARSPSGPSGDAAGPGQSSLAAAVPAQDSRSIDASAPGTRQDGARQDGARQDGISQDGISQDGAGQDGAGQDGAGQDGAGQDGTGRSRRAGWPGRPRSGRLALAAGGLALACTLLGGVVGGYIALHTAGSATNPSYSLGTVPPALTNRPASSVAGIAARVMPSVVMIKVNGGVGTGSGFIIRGDYIVTDNHVVTLDGELNNATLRVYFSNGQSAPAQVVGRDPYSDIAVIKAEGVTRLPALTLGNSTGVDVGDPVIAVGSPLGLADTVTSGIVSAVNRPVQPGETGSSPQVYFDAIQTDAAINPGNSGGPLVNARGQVIGVDAAIDTLGDNPLTGSQGGSIGLGFAIPIDQAKRVALELIRTGYATHAVIGAEIAAGWGGNGAEIMPAKAGSTSTVTPGGPAARAGLQPGDVITRFDGQTINNADTLLDAVRSLPPGAKAGLTFTQAGQAHTATIRLGSAPS